MITAYIGDVHGMLAELNALCTKLKASGVNRFVFLGDLIHKGPSSKDVVRYVRDLFLEFPKSVLIMGNHEESQIRFKRHIDMKSGFEEKMYNYNELMVLHKELEEEDYRFIENATLYFKDTLNNILCVHGGIPESLKTLPEEEYLYLSSLSGKNKKFFSKLMRLRHIDSSGKMVGLYEQSKETKMWAETYDGRFGKVLFGHQPYMSCEAKVFSNAVGIDLGCVFGGKLCAYVVSDGKSYLEYVNGTKYAENIY